LKKREFAVRLLFWLLPWPISRALPRSLRIYYWGPGAQPPPGWYYPPGFPGFPWPDPYNPPPPEDWPDLPPGPGNPGDPYVPGPGPGTPVDQPDNFISCFDNTFWEPKVNGFDRAVWDAANYQWDSVNIAGLEQVAILPIGTWTTDSRFSVMRVTFTVHDTMDFYIIDSAELLLKHEASAQSYVYIPLDFWRGNDLGELRFLAPVAVAFSVTNIEYIP